MLDFSKCYLGIEFGSTRIKAVVINENSLVMAQGGFSWENRFENGHWTYSEDLILTGLRSCYASLLEDILKKYSQTPPFTPISLCLFALRKTPSTPQ